MRVHVYGCLVDLRNSFDGLYALTRRQERLNADLKHAMGSKVPARTKAKLRSAATPHMTELEQSPERIKAFFQDKIVRYAA